MTREEAEDKVGELLEYMSDNSDSYSENNWQDMVVFLGIASKLTVYQIGPYLNLLEYWVKVGYQNE